MAASESPYAALRGDIHLDGPGAIIKSLLQCESQVGALVLPPDEARIHLRRAIADPDVIRLLADHEVTVVNVPEPVRGAIVACDAARGTGAVVLVPRLDERILEVLLAGPAEPDAGGFVVAVVLDDPRHAAPDVPEQVPMVVPGDVVGLLGSIDAAAQLAGAAHGLAVVRVHVDLMNMSDDVAASPNRVIDPVDEVLLRGQRRRRRVVPADAGNPLRVARRLELNRSEALPNPGERVAVGFVTCGPAAAALRHVAQAHGLVGRIPHVEVACVQPLDAVTVSRLLVRCTDVVVLAARPEEIEDRVLRVADDARRAGESPANVWGRFLPEDERPVELDEMLSPSRLIARLGRLLGTIRDRGDVEDAPVVRPAVPGVLPERTLALGGRAACAELELIVRGVEERLASEPVEEDGEERPPLALGRSFVSRASRAVPVEILDSRSFWLDGVALVRHAARAARPWLVLVAQGDGVDGRDALRLARGVVPADRAGAVQLVEGSFDDEDQLADLIRTAVLGDGLTVLVVRDPSARFDTESRVRDLEEVDRIGYEARQRASWSIDREAAVRPPPFDDAADSRPGRELRSSARIDRLPWRLPVPVRLRIRPLVEQVDVLRVRPPAERWGAEDVRLPLPEAVHARASRFRVHLAGVRGAAPGVATRVLTKAGQRMGYAVRSAWDETTIGPGRAAWSQVLFARGTGGRRRLSELARIPEGEADLIIGLDPREALRAMVDAGDLCVSRAHFTFIVLNDGLFTDQTEDESAARVRTLLDTAIEAATRPEIRLRADVAGACRAWFRTDRLTDFALLGIAFQSGLVPVTLDAMEGAVNEVESDGFARAREAFQFGRYIAHDDRILARPGPGVTDDADRVLRRMSHRHGARRRGRIFVQHLRGALEEMPGLRETDRGRRALRDFAAAMYRCWRWGGENEAGRFADLVTSLYRADRGAAGRELTRAAILPLAATMLIRDPVYLASITAGSEHRLRIRSRLNVKPARSDELERRFLTRIELIVRDRRLRLDVRSTSWPIRLLASLRFFLPAAWRGSKRERDLKAYAVSLATDAARVTDDESYARYRDSFQRLHREAVENRLRILTADEARVIADGAS